MNFDFDDSQAYRYENFELSTFYRFYFKKNMRNAGFFVQPFVSLTQENILPIELLFRRHHRWR